MGTFSLPPPSPENFNLVTHVNMISSCTTTTDPWVVLDESNIDTFGDRMSLNPIEIDYEAIYLACAVHSTLASSINWVDHSLYYNMSYDPFSRTFSTNESIMEIMISDDAPWDDHHHCSSLPDSF